MKKYCKFIIVLCTMAFFAFSSYAQGTKENEHIKIEVDTSDSICLPKLTLDYYSEVNFLEHAYDYDRIVKINRLKSQQRNVVVSAYVTYLGIMFFNGYLAVEYDWNIWIDIPCATAIALVSCFPLWHWHDRLQDKIEALSAQTAYLCPISDDVNLGLAHFSSNTAYHSYGIGLKITF